MDEPGVLFLRVFADADEIVADSADGAEKDVLPEKGRRRRAGDLADGGKNDRFGRSDASSVPEQAEREAALDPEVVQPDTAAGGAHGRERDARFRSGAEDGEPPDGRRGQDGDLERGAPPAVPDPKAQDERRAGEDRFREAGFGRDRADPGPSGEERDGRHGPQHSVHEVEEVDAAGQRGEEDRPGGDAHGPAERRQPGAHILRRGPGRS